MSFYSFEQIGGEFALLGGDVARGVPASAYGLTDARKYLVGALAKGRILYLTADAISAARAAAALSALTGERAARLTAKDEVLTYRAAGSKDALYSRLSALSAWENGARILVADIEAAIQLVPRRTGEVCLAVGDTRELGELAGELVRLGYQREYEVSGRGAFALRGDILDIFPVNAEHPVRIDFFGDEVEAIKPYDEVTGERYPLAEGVRIVAATDAVATDGDREKIRAVLDRELACAPSADALSRMRKIADALNANGSSDFVLPLLANSACLFDLLPGDTLLIFDECKLICDKLDGLYKEHAERYRTLYEGGECMRFSLAQYIPQEKLSFNGRRCLALSTFMGNVRLFTPMAMHAFTSAPARRYLNSLPELATDIRAWLKTGYRVMLYAGSGERVQKLEDLLTDAEIPYALSAGARLDGFRGVAVLSETLESGFLLHECKLAVIGTGDLFTKRAPEKRIRRRRGDLFLAPEVGDYAVHETHGIGRVTGTKKIETGDGVKEYVALEYRGGDTLYVPVEQMDVLSKYMGGDAPALSKIGGAEFERVKARVRASLKKMAFDLKQLYAERQERRGYVFPEYREEMEEFEAAFPYEETADQLRSIAEIKEDMCSDKVMDRLLCGDVGFGKTEVALRAAYLCILAGRQTALMCPSTVLSEQHFRTACERMGSFGVRVAALNRFRTEREIQTTLAALKKGEIDLVVGTHRLLSDDVVFSDLGLLILDEEQRFGVEHKEKIKNVKRNVDCLTMTATPIPRTLHLSLSGIRDISTIQTPPSARLPVQTYVAEETETLIRDACVREIARKGQIFLLYNRVESILDFAAKVQAIVPEARVTVAHGRMEHTALEKNVFGFYRGEYDILVTTTIIENGIDLPNANTLIVIDSDRLGIAQLYQLRGRVGRGTRLAHAYFTYKPERVMTENAAERLKAVMQFTELGSGFKIAMRDLEIRGAGNVLGAEQHGQMDKVGYELYSKILKEELTGERRESVDLDVKVTAYLPESYVESNAGRMDCYKQIAEIRSLDDYKRVCDSMEENYGPLPPPALNLLVIAVMKSYAAPLRVKKVSVGAKGGVLEFCELGALSTAGMAAAMQKYAALVSLEMTTAPRIRFKNMGDGSKTMLQMTRFLKFAANFK